MVLQGRGCLIVVGLSAKSVAPVSDLEKIHPQTGEMFLKLVKRKHWEEPLQFLGALSLKDWEDMAKAG